MLFINSCVCNRYHPYIDNYDRATSVIDRLMGGNKKGAFLDRLRKVLDDKEAGVSTFLSLLIRPVQAVPRYRLLVERLKNLLAKDTKAQQAEHEREATIRAELTVLSVAAKLNDSLKVGVVGDWWLLSSSLFLFLFFFWSFFFKISSSSFLATHKHTHIYNIIYMLT
jgi:hypothetical protein